MRLWGGIEQLRRKRKSVCELVPRGAADLLAGPHGTLLQGVGSLHLALAAVQGPQVSQGGVHRWAGQKNSDPIV